MNKRQTYNMGKSDGYNIASSIDLPDLGDKIDPSIDWVGLGKTVTAENVAEYFSLIAHESESNSRQYSEFSFAAHDINECPNADSLWESYENGIERGIVIAWNERKEYYKD